MLALYEYFWSLSSDYAEVLYLFVSEEKTNQLLKREGERLLIDLLISNIFSKLILSLNFKTAKRTVMRILRLIVHNSKFFLL